jgi:hypothetical protein
VDNPKPYPPIGRTLVKWFAQITLRTSHVLNGHWCGPPLISQIVNVGGNPIRCLNPFGYPVFVGTA